MCATLTENVVLIRTRSHDLNSVKKLNCWGCALKDVSIVHRMPNVEVISLSINSIDTLENFAACEMLQELYLRKNEIKDINQILHLSQLQFLKKLSLEDNPCTGVESYRLTVLKTLPNLEFLDNVRVTPEEIYQAEKFGRDLVWPGSESEMADEEINELNEDVEYTNGPLTHSTRLSDHGSHTSLTTTPSTNGFAMPAAPEPTYCSQIIEEPVVVSSSSSSNQSSTAPASSNRNSGSHLNSCANAKEPATNYASNGKNSNMAKSNSLSDYNLYHNGNNYRNTSPPPMSVNNYEPSEYSYENGHTGGHSVQPYSPAYHQNGSTRTIPSSASSQPRLLPKGGKNRNANILSAVLCLIKELDYGSLEVVDTTIHCRMEEMED